MFRFAIATMILLLAPSLAEACQCAPREGSHAEQVRHEFADSTAVFSGRVERIHYADVHGARTRMAAIRVLQAWKGGVKPDAIVHVASDAMSGPMFCGYEAQPGASLLVYARGERPFALHTCSRTGELEQAQGDLPFLRALSTKDSAAKP